MMKYDVVYYWVGGTESGRWHAADPFVSKALGGVDGNVQALVERTERMGYHCVPGIRNIGAPEGAPTQKHPGCCCELCSPPVNIFRDVSARPVHETDPTNASRCRCESCGG